MSAEYALRFVLSGGSTVLVSKAVKLRYSKDIYTMGTLLSGSAVWSGDASQIVGIRLDLGGKRVHEGYASYVRSEYRSGRQTVNFESQGWSVMLGQNEPVPGMNFNVDLAAVGALNVQIPNVTFESGTAVVNYIYVKEHSTIWDALTAYGMKAYGRLPYIYGANEVRVRAASGTARTYDPARIVSEAVICDRRGMHSKVYMADADGQYNYSASDAAATADGIVREKYYALDRQWLSSPTTGLEMRLKLARRRSRMKALVKLGYDGEDLFDSYRITGSAEAARLIGGIEVVIAGSRTECTLYEVND